MSTSELFGTTPSGEEVWRYRLHGGGLTAQVLTLGATVQDLRLEGWPFPLVLGAKNVADYLGPFRYFGSLVGRFANRIAGGAFTLDEQEFHLDRNDQGKHCLHGGHLGCDAQIWQVLGHDKNSIEMALNLPDGQMGFSGNMKVVLLITLTDQAGLEFDIQAQCDRSTPCSFAHHGYFNLDGGKDISGHLLEIAAEEYLPTDDEGIPLEASSPVADTPFDFRMAKPVGDHSIDHNFCLSSGQVACRRVASLSAPVSGIAMTVETTEPGLQVFDAVHLPVEGLAGIGLNPYGPKAGLALETQCWPDAPNRVGFPSWILRPGETYRHRVRYVFSGRTTFDLTPSPTSGNSS